MEYQQTAKDVQNEQPKTCSSSLHQTSFNLAKVYPLLELQRTIGNQAVLNLLRSRTLPSDSSTQAPIEPYVGHDFSRISTYAPATRVIQTKLTINQPGDQYEQEADRISQQMSATPAYAAASGVAPLIQHFSGESNEQMNVAPVSVELALASRGGPLEPVLRQDMEQRLGYDFSSVRIHTDAQAAESARDVNAYAYTAGHDIVFGTGRFAPGTHEGRRLIAHELTHVVQQGDLNANVVRRSPPGGKVPEANGEILGASESTSETVVLYHYGNLEGVDLFKSSPGYPRLTDCGIATSQAEVAEYTGTPVTNNLVYKYELKIDRAYFEKNFIDTGTRKGYSEFVTKQSIPIKYFRIVLKLTPASTTPATSITGQITVPQRGSVTPTGGSARPVTSVAGEITVPQRGSVTPTGGSARPVTSVAGEITVPQRGSVTPTGGTTRAVTSAAGEITPKATPPTIRPTTMGRIVGGASTVITVVGSIALLKQLQDAFAGRVEIELKDLDPGDFEVGHEFRQVPFVKDEHDQQWYIDIRVERNLFFMKRFYAVNIYTIA
ncbi:eCIS core domain-containing protein [Dictyobacter formicarum]|uniref:eCIS core domain-containing protein n=1 Tax=Dictyobacter formicarum TaxID=2778368 RepID=A0ABQ3VDH4_9CHLR|nr:DUF4157 domain-containing protein [Dictyobacter formicarum]GHO83206.1 hypothetical protein KSZ_12120 [Dictyobacter formicarum]